MCCIAVESYFRPGHIVVDGPCSVELFAVAEPYSVESFADAVPCSVDFAGPLPVESRCSAYNSGEPYFPAAQNSVA